MRRDWSPTHLDAKTAGGSPGANGSTGKPLTVRNVEKRFRRGGECVVVFGGVSFEVGCGELVGVVGGRLEGKSTLLRVAGGLERPSEGSVLVGGRLVSGFSDRERSRLLGREVVWVDRDGPGLRVSAARFVGWPLTLHGRGRREVERAACVALERVGALGCAGRSWGEISNWQRVLVGLARAFVASPRLVVIDDLLDALGSSGSERAAGLLRELVESSEVGCGVLMSACDLDSAMFADRVLSLRRGRLKPIADHAAALGGNVIPFPGGLGSDVSAGLSST